MKKHRSIHIKIRPRNKIESDRSSHAHSKVISSKNKTLNTSNHPVLHSDNVIASNKIQPPKINQNIDKLIKPTKLNQSLLFFTGFALLSIFTLAAIVLAIYVLVVFETTTTTTTATTTTTTAPSCIPQSYTGSFTNGVVPTTAQCTSWTTFRTTLNCSYFKLLQFNGSLNSIGISVVDPIIVNAIAAALFNSTAFGPTLSNGYNWTVTSPTCGVGVELGTGNVCACTVTQYAIRPCIANTNFGGMNGTTCYPQPSQTITVTFS